MRSLLAVADTGAITEAAQRLGLTQPALSRRIQQLEGHLGAELLVRGRKGATLTSLGEFVETEARILISRYDQLKEHVAAQLRLEGGTVRVGGGATAVSFILPAAIAAFQADHPGVRFQVKEAGSREVEADVVNGRLDLGLVTLPARTPDLHIRPLVVDPIVLVARHNHPLVARGRVSVGQLAGLSLVGFEGGSAIRQIIDLALRNAGVEMNVVMELRSIPAILRMVATTGNLAFVSRLGVETQSDIRILPLDGMKIERRLAIITRGDAALSPASNAFSARLAGMR